MRIETLDSYLRSGGAQSGPRGDQIDFFEINGTVTLRTFQINSKGEPDYLRQAPYLGNPMLPQPDMVASLRGGTETIYKRTID